eukprot:795220-Rhodomonas_salina.3
MMIVNRIVMPLMGVACVGRVRIRGALPFAQEGRRVEGGRSLETEPQEEKAPQALLKFHFQPPCSKSVSPCTRVVRRRNSACTFEPSSPIPK